MKLTSANFTGMYDAIDNSQGTAAETAAAMDTGIGGAFRLTESALEGVKHALGDALTPTLKELADEIQRVAGTTSAWIAENKETVVWIVKAAAVATVAGGSMLALGQGAKMASSTFSALRTVGQGYVGVLNALTGSSNAATRAKRAREIAQKKLTVETKAQAQLDRAYAADRGVADAEKELRAAKLSKDATRIKTAEDKLADARDLVDAETTNYASFDVETARGLVRQTANEVKGFAFEATFAKPQTVVEECDYDDRKKTARLTHSLETVSATPHSKRSTSNAASTRTEAAVSTDATFSFRTRKRR